MRHDAHTPDSVGRAASLSGLDDNAILYASLDRVRTGDALQWRTLPDADADGLRHSVVDLDANVTTRAATRLPEWSACVDGRLWLTATGEATLKARPMARAETAAFGALCRASYNRPCRVTAQQRGAFDALRAWGIARYDEQQRHAYLTPWGRDVLYDRLDRSMTRMVECPIYDATRYWCPAWEVPVGGNGVRYAFRLERRADGSLRACGADDVTMLRPHVDDASDLEAWSLIDHGTTYADLITLGFRRD